jgi:hypothetical protein
VILLYTHWDLYTGSKARVGHLSGEAILSLKVG